MGEVDSSKGQEAPAAPVVAAKPKKKKIVIEEVDSSKVEEDSCDSPDWPQKQKENLDRVSKNQKQRKKKIVIEEVDSSKVEEAPAAPVVAAKPKKAKKIVIEEV